MALTSGFDPVLIEKWNQEAKVIYEQMESRFPDEALTIVNSKQKTFNYPIMANEDAIEGKARFADLTITEANTDAIPITTSFIYQRKGIDDIDAFQTDVSLREAIMRTATGAVMRAYDDKIITALNGTTVTETTLPSANTFNYNGAVALGKALHDNNVPENERYAVLSPSAEEDLLTDTTAINNFHFENSAVRDSSLKRIAGLNYSVSTRLPNGDAGATERRVFAWHKGTLVVVKNRPFGVNVFYDERSMAWLFTAFMQVGAAVIDDNGLAFADITN